MPLRPGALVVASALFAVAALPAMAAEPRQPLPLLRLAGSVTDPEQIDYARLPRVEGAHAVVSAAKIDPAHQDLPKVDMHHLKFQLHSYLIHHQGRFWCLWSEGPPIEDEPTQEVRYATSKDGLVWSESQSVTGVPDAPYGFIARGLWVRDGELLALAARYKGKGAFGADKELELRAYAWDEAANAWRFKQKVYDNAINNFAPQQLPGGEWIMTRRDARFNVSMLIGGKSSLDQWQAYPVVERGAVAGFSPDEPIFWPLASGELLGLFRDNGGSRRLFQATSNDAGRTWSAPHITNFPNATSKLYGLKTSRGDWLLCSNANPGAGRRELHLSASADGKTFTAMGLLAVPTPPEDERLGLLRLKFRSGIASLQYPHIIEHNGQLYIALSRGKKQIEVFRVPLEQAPRP